MTSYTLTKKFQSVKNENEILFKKEKLNNINVYLNGMRENTWYITKVEAHCGLTSIES
jgi:hypothetical protein